MLLLGGLILFTFSQVIADIPFGDGLVWANIGLLAALVTTVITLATAIQIGARRWGKKLTRSVLLAPVAGVILIVVLLSLPSPPTPVAFTEPFLPGRPHDIVVLVDPSDPAVRTLVRQASTEPDVIAPESVPLWGIDVAFGLAVLNPPGADAAWSLVLSPTPDYGRVVQGFAGLAPSAAARTSTSLALAFRDLAAPAGGRVTWREGATRTIAFVTPTLPAQVEQHGGVWDAALAELGRSEVLRPDHPRRSSLSVLYDRATGTAGERWRTWTEEAAGNVAARTPGFTLFDDVAFKSLNRFFFDDISLGFTYRPRLKLHSDERFLPLNVDDFVARTKPQLCQPRQFSHDPCKTYSSAPLLYKQDGYLKLGGERRGGEDLPADPPDAKQLIYYTVTRKPGSVTIEYWWFFRYNASPVWDGVMCLAGLSVLERSCFDHQGDWEGISITLKPQRGAPPRPSFVSFYGHNWPGYRYRWKTLQRWNSIAERTHPVVYVAKGSHASYPRPCPTGCRQQDFRFSVAGIDVPLPDGEHDGLKDAPPKGCICLSLLPVDFDGRPATWNAFRGNWGAPLCTFVLKACTRSLGPPSPAFQPRYGRPHRTVWASVEAPALTGSEPAP